MLQFIQNNQVVFSVNVSSGSFRRNLFAPGDYDLRVLYDENNNGKWDPGQFFGTKRQPELSRQLRQRLSVKANYDNELDLTL